MEPKSVPYRLIIVIFILAIFSLATCDIAKDKAMCANQLVGLATCLPYVSGESNANGAPPMGCCTAFNQVLLTSPLCICLLVKDRDDPSVGLHINATLALSLPVRCKTPGNPTVQQCPALLHLPPNSSDAKVFDDFAHTANKSNHATSPRTPGSNLGAASGEGGILKRNGWLLGMTLLITAAAAPLQILLIN